MADTTETTEGYLQEGEVTSPILAEGLTTQHEERVENAEGSAVSSLETPAVPEAVAEPEPDSETPLKGFMNDYSNEETDEERSEDEDQGDAQTVASPNEDTVAFASLSPPPAPTTPSSDASGLVEDEPKEKEEGENPVDTAPVPTLMDDDAHQEDDEDDAQQEEDEEDEEEEGVDGSDEDKEQEKEDGVSGSSEEDVVQLESEGGSSQDSEHKEKDDHKPEDSNGEEDSEDEDEDDSEEKDADPLDTLKKLASEAKSVDQQAFPRDTVGLSSTQGAPRPTVGEKKPLFSTQPRHLPIFSDSDSASDEDASSDGSQHQEQGEEVDNMSDDGPDNSDEEDDDDDDDDEMQVPTTSRPSSSSVTLHATTTTYEPQEIDDDNDDENDDQDQEGVDSDESEDHQKQAKRTKNGDDSEDLDNKDKEEDEEIEGSDEEEQDDYDDLDGLSEPFSQAKRTVGKKWARDYESPAASHLQKKRARLDSASPSDSSPSEDQDKDFEDQYEEDDENDDQDQVVNKHQRRPKEGAADDDENDDGEEEDSDEWEAVSSDLEPLQDQPIQTTSFRERPSLKDLLDDYDEDDEVFGLAEDDQIGDVQSSDDLSDSEEEVDEDGEEYEDSEDEPPQRIQSAFASASQNKFANYNRQTGRNVVYQFSAPAPADDGVIDLDSDSEDDAPPPAPQQQQQQQQQKTADSESEYEEDDEDEEEEETTQKFVAPPSQPQAPQSAPKIEVDRVAGSQIIANLDKKHQDIVNLIAQKEKETKRYKTFVRLSSFLDGHKAGNLLPREGNTTDLIKVTHYLLQLIAAKTASIQEEIETNRVVKNLLEDVQEYQGKLIATQCLLKTKKTEMEDKANRLRVCDLLLTTISLIKDFQQKQAKRKATTPTRPLSSSSSLSRSVV